MNLAKSILALTGLLFAASAAPALAAPDAQSVFELLQGQTYDEIYSYFYEDGRSAGDTLIKCLVADSSENCDRGYGGFAANDLNGDGSSVVGSVDLVTTDSQGRGDQAAVWDTATNTFVLLDDYVGSEEHFDDSPLKNWGLTYNDIAEELQYGTTATDISSTTNTIVGYARGSFYCDCRMPDFAFPLIWNPDGSGWDVGEVLPYETENPHDVQSIGWATAISEFGPLDSDREYVVGAVGHVFSDSSVDDVTAALWTHSEIDGWSLQTLGGSEANSGAEDVNDIGEIVGWTGNLDSINDYFNGWDGYGNNGGRSWTPSAVVWTPNGNSHDIHLLNGTDQNLTDYIFSDATAVANDDPVVVGWVAGSDLAPCRPQIGSNCRSDNSRDLDMAPNAAAWINSNWDWTESSLINLQSELGIDAQFGTLGSVQGQLVGSMAEGVDAHGRLVVGKGFYTDGDTNFTNALYWELDAEGNVTAGGSLEQALVAAGVPMDDKDLTLTDATALRVYYDADGNPTDVYITGTGVGSFGSWIATLSGITTPDSIGKGPKVVKKATDDVASVLGGIADDQYCRRPTGTSVSDAPWCYFVVGVAGGEISNNAYGLGLAKTVGIAKYTDESTSFGATGGLSVSHGHVEGGSNYTALTATVGAYADHSPETGLQGRASIVLGRIIDATFNRVYVNGASTSTSTGSTSGFGAGFFGRVGYASSLDEATRTIPFVEVRLATVNLDAFTDTGGTFNGSFDATSQTSGSIRIGIDAEHALNAQTLLTGGVSITAAGTTGTGVNATIAAQQFGVSGTGFAAYASGNVGVIYQIDATSSFTGQATGFVGLNGLVGGSVLAKYSKVF